jgi:hypothetical protein
MADFIDRQIARVLRACAAIFDPPPVTPPPVLLPADDPMVFKRWALFLSDADSKRGAWTYTLTIDGQPPVTAPLTTTTTFRTPAGLNFDVVQNFTDLAGLVYLPSKPVTTPAHPRTPPPCLRFLGFEDAPEPPTLAAVGPDDPSLVTI